MFVYVLSDRLDPYGPLLEAAGIQPRSFASKRSLSATRAIGLARQLHRDRIELAHGFLYIASAYLYLATRLCPSVRLVTSARNCKREPSRFRRAVIGAAFRASDAVICNSETVGVFAAEHYGLSEARRCVVYNGVDADRFHRGPVRSGELVVGTVGRIEAQKNLGFFLEAAARVLREKPDARFEIAGDGSLKADLVTRARTLGIGERVAFVGETNDVASFLRRLSQFWLTSEWEGTPNVILEAMAAGLPVLATSVGAVPELLDHGVDGLLVECGDVDSLASLSLAVADDEDLADRLGKAARKRAVSAFSVDAMVDGTRALYERVLGAAG